MVNMRPQDRTAVSDSRQHETVCLECKDKAIEETYMAFCFFNGAKRCREIEKYTDRD